jgi:hypothetical protein
MPRSRRSRVLASLLGLWFLVAGQEPPFAHPCEMGMATTSLAAESAGPVASDAGAEDEHAGHAGHLGHAESAASPSEHSDDAPSHDTCECIGDCCCAPAMDCVAEPTQLAWSTTTTYTTRVAVTFRAPSTATRYLLPWANAPPHTLT